MAFYLLYYQRVWNDSGRFGSHSDLLKMHISVAHYVSKWAHTEILCFVFENAQNNLISDMPVLFR